MEEEDSLKIRNQNDNIDYRKVENIIYNFARIT